MKKCVFANQLKVEQLIQLTKSNENNILELTKLNTVEEFCSIQGESSYSGRLCYFIRLAKCNLRCKYCDTLYAQKSSDGKNRSLQAIINDIKKSQFELIEITGGEPLLQQKAVNLLCKELLKNNISVMIETNGSQLINSIPDEVIKIIDIKTPSSGEDGSFNIENVKFLQPHDQIKFVIGNREDYDFALKHIKNFALENKVKEILFSPIWDKIEHKKLVKWLVEDNIKNVRFQLQIHKIIWHPDEKGV